MTEKTEQINGLESEIEKLGNISDNWSQLRMILFAMLDRVPKVIPQKKIK